ncbi:MAG: hypothetical protein ACHQ0J_15410 [Candidatus Dormibacterales bacterium]
MGERVILAVKYTPAGSLGQVRKAVGGFLRYVQHRDLHPTEAKAKARPDVSGLLKYVAYRDRASTRAELFGPTGSLGSAERKAFANFVAGAIDSSRPQLFRNRNGELVDRRRAVYRKVISPERAAGLDLERLTRAAVGRLENESGTGLRWIAAIHRNTKHHHVHVVLAGMREDGNGGFSWVDITKPRLAAMKEALLLEIERQRTERMPTEELARVPAPAAGTEPAAASPTAIPVFAFERLAHSRARHLHPTPLAGSVMALRAVARRYQRQMERELEEGYRRMQWEQAA